MSERLETLLELICETGAPDLCSEVRSLLRRANRPGPVIAIAGAEGRGKSTVMQRLLGLDKGSTARVAHGPDWTPTDLRDLPAKGPRYLFEKLEDIVVIEAPAFDCSCSREIAKAIVEAADLVFFIVQSTSPGNEDEVRYASEQLKDRPCFLVLSKADLAEDELDEAFEFAARAFDGIDWMGVFVSGPINDRARVEDWWQSSGLDSVRQARTTGLESRATVVAGAGLEWIDSHIERLVALETCLCATTRKSESLHEIAAIKTAIRSDLRQIPRLAAEVFGKQRGSYSTGFRAVLNGALAASDPSVEVNLKELAQNLNAFLAGWDGDVRSKVRDTLRPEIESLFAKSQRFSQLLERLELSKVSQVKVLSTASDTDETLFHAPDVELSEAEKRRAVLNPILGGGATVLLGHTLLAFLGPAAWLAGLAGGLGVFNMNRAAQGEQNRRKFLNDLERAMVLQSSQVYNELEERFARDWRSYTYSIEAQLAPALRAADIAELTEADRPEVRTELLSVREELSRWLELRTKLRTWAER